ncbi:hypothetical protein ACJX0J_030921, partial [Zea mays]
MVKKLCYYLHIISSNDLHFSISALFFIIDFYFHLHILKALELSWMLNCVFVEYVLRLRPSLVLACLESNQKIIIALYIGQSELQVDERPTYVQNYQDMMGI